MGKTAIVLGATGVVGRELVRQLAIQTDIDKIVSLTRRPVSYSNAKVDNQVVDFDNLKSSSQWFKGDLLFSALGTTLKQAGSIDAQRKVDVDYQYHAAEIAAQQGVSHYLLVSSSGANAQSRSAYLKMKGELEQRVQQLPFNRISIVQPSLLLGERTDFRLGERLAATILPLMCRLPPLAKYRPITGAQVAKAMIALSQQPGHPIETISLDQLFLQQG
ncbi:NAD(P)H-binding protein [Ferrimonas aestuarii]|uniref:NAD-dependent epimerase/dehydratase family protein n=1 Tax=Ferrimonas aestuarii TaxID=2569539 RepID=A0A4V5NWD2_9GAMM|nr:NAD(P)H-binding protein [Ferrimonas aestuarii]TKB56714.1 NAD-dependent epimerase/dehydratase family protein [Ferrimonas aestuarii]